jgi:hypothetical protein
MLWPALRQHPRRGTLSARSRFLKRAAAGDCDACDAKTNTTNSASRTRRPLMSYKESHEMEGSLKECLRELVVALGGHDFEVAGDRVTVKDEDRTLTIDLVYEGNRRLGSLDLPMTRVDYAFVGYDEPQAKDFMAHLSQHMMRAGGG